MNDNEIKKVIEKEANRISGVIGVAAVAAILVAFCALVIGVCWAGAWMMVRLAS